MRMIFLLFLKGSGFDAHTFEFADTRTDILRMP